VYRKRIGEEVV